jgi:hypothetical protein
VRVQRSWLLVITKKVQRVQRKVQRSMLVNLIVLDQLIQQRANGSNEKVQRNLTPHWTHFVPLESPDLRE